MKREKIVTTPFVEVYPYYVAKVERKGHTKEELHEIIFWLTGYDEVSFQKQLDNRVMFEAFFDEAPHLNENVILIKGVICGYRVEEMEEGFMKKMRYLDKLVDELAKGKKMDKILRQ